MRITISVVLIIIFFFELANQDDKTSVIKNKTIYSWPPTTERIIYQTLPPVHINTQLFLFFTLKKYIWLHCSTRMNTNCWDSKEVTNLRIITLCCSNCRLGFSQGFPVNSFQWRLTAEFTTVCIDVDGKISPSPTTPTKFISANSGYFEW